MTSQLVEDRLRALAATAEPTISAPPWLATAALARAGHQRQRRRLLLAGGGALAIAGAVVAARAQNAGPYRDVVQPSAAMAPTVELNESVIVDTELMPQIEDVVLINISEGSTTFDAVKRVEALPGDTIACPPAADGTCHHLVRNSEVVDEPFLADTAGEPFGPVTVPAGMVYVLGDNREESADSRVWGPVPLTDIDGVVVRIVGTDGVERVVPGAPPHPAPDGGGVNPQETPPPAQVAPVS